jgi:NADH-quinone oxidoreductase subunit F
MSRNLSHLSSRQGVERNLFERMVAAADARGTAEETETVQQLGRSSLFGDALTLGAVSAYDFLKKENAGKKVFVCNGSACLCAGTQTALHDTLRASFEEKEIGHICCIGHCHTGGAFQLGSHNYSGLAPDAIAALARNPSPPPAGPPYSVTSLLPQPILTATFPGIASYYQPFRQLLASDRDAFLAELKAAGLRGRGGAGFPAHFKWQSCREAPGTEKYIVCNADEGDPGAYIDMYLMEQQPHSVLLGMMVAGWFAGASTGILYIRAEYPDSIRIIEAAIADLHAAGLLGRNIAGSGFDFSLKTIKGAGAYICGEETALLSSIEGQRPEVRVRPPFPTVQGLFRKPTIVSNVETFANLHAILTLGGKAYGSIGTAQSTGPKLLSLDSHFVRPGIYEAPMGLPLKDVFAAAGGFRKPVKAIHIGGPLGGLIPLALTDSLTVDFESFKSAGFLLGHAGVIAIPEAMPMIDYLEHLFQFTADESCGKCFPCRLGSTRGRELIAKARNDASFRIDPELIGDLLDTMEQTSLCALGGGVPLPVRNALRYFRSELQPFFAAPLP